MSLYSLLLIGSVCVPLVLSFDRRLHFYTRWPAILPSIAVIAFFFILVDVWFTHMGVWGFNARYHSSIRILGLPLEEYLFFFVVPYASLFIHYSLKEYFPRWQMTETGGKRLTWFLLAVFLILLFLNLNRYYTAYISILMLVTLVLSLFDKTRSINRFYYSFLVILIPFILVNATLTGTFIPEEVVWYNEEQNLGIRFLTIPVEDFAYGFSMLQLMLIASGGINRIRHKRI